MDEMHSEVTTRRLGRTLALPATWHYVSLICGAIFLLYINQGQWFFQDEWDFLAERSVTIGSQGPFDPLNEHWSTTPILIYGLLFHLFGLSTYVPYVSVVIIAHLIVVHLVWRVMLRSRIEPWIATVFCAAFLPFGPGADNLLFAMQINFVGSAAAGLAAILLQDDSRSSARRLAARWGTSVFALTFSGISVPLVAGSAVAAWLRRGIRAFLIAASVPGIVYLVWLFAVGQRGLGAVPVSEETLREAPAFFATAIVAALSLGTPTFLTGLIPLTLTLVALALRRRGGRPLPHAAIAAAVAEVLVLIMFAIGRSGLGAEAGSATRYVYMAGALLLPLMLVGLSDLARRRTAAVALILALAVPFGVNNARLLLATAEQEEEREQIIREQYVAAVSLFDPEEVLLTKPEPYSSPTLDLAELRILLPPAERDIEVSREAIMRAALALQVSVTAAPRFSPEAVRLSDLGAIDAELQVAERGCLTATPVGPQPGVVIPIGSPSSYAIMPAADQELQLLLTADDLGADYATFFEVSAADLSYINVAVDGDLVGPSRLLVVIASPVQICLP